MSYEVLPEFEQDSPEWHEARRQGLGASEVAAVLGLSPWQTPLSVWRTKQGIPNEIPEDLAYFGHALEPVIAKWIEDKRPEVGALTPGISVRSVEWPWLTASPDRIVLEPVDPYEVQPIPVELKTSSAYSKDKWADGVPLYYQAQVQTQIAVIGAPYGWLAVLHGGNSPELFRVERDDQFIDQLVHITDEWWNTYVVGEVAPEPTVLAELNPSEPGTAVTGSEAVLEAAERRAVLLSDIQAQKEEADALTLAIGTYMDTAETLTDPAGQPVLTFKTQAGRKSVPVRDLETRHPDIARELVTQSAPFRVMRYARKKAS